MIARAVIVLVSLTTVVSGAGEKQLSGRELAEFLGPVSPELLTWQKTILPDAVVYSGLAKPPLSSNVSISINLWTWGPHVDEIAKADARDRVGVIPGNWNKASWNGMYLAGFSFSDADKRKLWITINSPVESEMDMFVREVSRLPMFNSTRSTPFHELMVRKNIARLIDFMIFLSLFVLSVWLPVRSLRKRHVGVWGQALLVDGISGAWLTVWLVNSPIYLAGLFGPTFAAIWESNASARLFATPLMALTCLVLSSLIFASLSLRWLVLRLFAARR